MTLISYLWAMRVVTFFALSAWLFVVFYVDPEKTGLPGQMFFYLTTLLLFSGIFSLFLAWLRRRYAGIGNGGEIGLATSFRQGFLLAILLVLLMIFQSFRILVWWDGMLAAAGIFLVELYFLTRR